MPVEYLSHTPVVLHSVVHSMVVGLGSTIDLGMKCVGYNHLYARHELRHLNTMFHTKQRLQPHQIGILI